MLSRQLSGEIAKKMYMENERPPDMPKIPILPSTRQQELHNITHHPFQSWCEACVVGRSKQSPHESGGEQGAGGQGPFPCNADAPDRLPTRLPSKSMRCSREKKRATARRPEPSRTQRPSSPRTADDDYENQHGLCLVGAESTTGWTVAIPIAQKGSSSLKWVTEHLIRLSMLVLAGEPITIQCDPEAPIKQVANAVESCRTRLGLATHKVWVPRASHASDGAVLCGPTR